MCLACEQGDLEARWRLVEVIADGRMPDGHTADDLRALGLPQPGELYREMQLDGTVLIRQMAPKKSDTAFACDTPVHD
ncbi:MAG: hypothetical protein WDN48_13315 [Pseudolabrys sp.]